MSPVTIFLAFTVCLADAPHHCRHVEIAAPSPVACATKGQGEIVRWLKRRPEYRLAVAPDRPAYLCVWGDPA